MTTLTRYISTDYYPFGSVMPGRNSNSDEYRFGFNGQENDNEISGQTGTNTTAMFWEYDSRLGRRWNLDPIVKDWESPYLCFSGNPVCFSDPNGDDGGPGHRRYHPHKVRRRPRGNSAVRGIGKGIAYWLTDLYNDIFNDDAAHKVRAGHYMTSPWVTIGTAQGNGVNDYRFIGGGSDYLLRNVRIQSTTTHNIAFVGMFTKNNPNPNAWGIPLQFGLFLLPTDPTGTVISTGFSLQGSIVPGAFWPLMKRTLTALTIGNPIIAVVYYVAINVNISRINPAFRNRRDFRSVVYADGTPNYNVSIRYRMWQAGAPANIVRQFFRQIFRRIFYGQMRP